MSSLCRLDRRPRLKREQEKIVTRAFACSSSAAGGSRSAVLLNYASVFARRVAQNRARRCHRSEMTRHDYALAFRQQRILSYRIYLSHGPQGYVITCRQRF